MKITGNINDSLAYIKERFQFSKNFDFKLREFKIPFKDGCVHGFLCFYDGMSSTNYINRDVLKSLIRGNREIPLSAPREDAVYEQISTYGNLIIVKTFEDAITNVTFGNCIIFVDGCASAFVADVKNWGGRGVGEPTQEASLSGPQEAFNEIIMTDIALIRKILKNVDLIAEHIPVGKVSQTPCALMYINGVTNHKLVDEIRNRLKGIDTSYIFSSGDIEMLIEDTSFLPITRTLKTERPDRAASLLAEGKVVIVVHGSPFVIALPTTAADLIEASEDNYVRVPEANFMRFVRLAGMYVSLFLPGLFVAIMLYHHEILPTDLLLAIEASREKVPFPIFAELLLMELSLELIKEASIRVPSPVGSTLGIIGGLILGQAAVEANIVSPILIIIVSLTGLGTFAAPSVSMSRSLSLMRFIYIIFSGLGGLLGLTCGMLLTLALLSATETFNVPFLSPFSPKNGDSVWGTLLIKPIWKKEQRPTNLRTQNPIKQPHISRKWLFSKEDKK